MKSDYIIRLINIVRIVNKRPIKFTKRDKNNLVLVFHHTIDEFKKITKSNV